MFDRRVAIPTAAWLVAAAALVSPREGRAQSPCDPGLERLARGANGYKLVGDRCEGIYTREVAGTTLFLASLTEAFENYDLTSHADLVVEWAGPGDGATRLRAQGIRRDLYYRMDAVRPAGSRSYRWPSDLLTAQRIARGDIGVVGWTRYRVGTVERDVYLPLRITQHNPATETGVYELVVFPAVALKEVYITVATVGVDGNPERFIQRGRPLGRGFYPAERLVSASLPRLEAAGIYYLEVSADVAAGGSVALPCWMYHAPAPSPN